MPLRAGPGGLVVAHGEPVQVERVVSLPRLGGPWIGGLPHDGQGFLATDAHGAVLGVDAVWAAGDGTAFPLKQGGLAAQQAGAAAAAIAAFLGADVRPEPFRPVLRGMLLDPAGPRFLDATRGDLPTTPLWSAATKVAAPHLGEYLEPGAPHVPAGSEEIDVGDLLLALAERHATLGENALALRCLDAAVQVRGTLPPEAAARRERAGQRARRELSLLMTRRLCSARATRQRRRGDAGSSPSRLARVAAVPRSTCESAPRLLREHPPGRAARRARRDRRTHRRRDRPRPGAVSTVDAWRATRPPGRSRAARLPLDAGPRRPRARRPMTAQR